LNIWHATKVASETTGINSIPGKEVLVERKTNGPVNPLFLVILSNLTLIFPMFLGTCPGLYTPNELFLISNQLLPGGKRGARRVENQDIAQERYFRRVRSHLHVVVCLKYRKLDLSNSLEKNQLYKFPKLVTRSCCVDIYRAWPHEALVSIAQKQLEEEESVFSLLPLKRREKDAQSAAVCSIMAHVHLSSRCMARRIYGIEALKFYSPDTFLDFIDLFRKICRRICLKEKVSMIYFMNDRLQ